MYVYLNKFPTLQFLILNISAVTSAIKRIFRMWVSEAMKKLSLEKNFLIRVMWPVLTK